MGDLEGMKVLITGKGKQRSIKPVEFKILENTPPDFFIGAEVVYITLNDGECANKLKDVLKPYALPLTHLRPLYAAFLSGGEFWLPDPMTGTFGGNGQDSVGYNITEAVYEYAQITKGGE